jgi:hypothetical protein
MVVLDEFKEQYIWHKYWNFVFKSNTIYNNQIRLCFEDFIGNANYVSNKLSIPLINYQSSKSPYNKNNIKNLDEIKKYYLDLEYNYQYNQKEFMNIHSKKILKNTT